MDKWIKENKITTNIIVVLIMVFGIVYFYKYQNTSSNEQLGINQTASVDLQQKCATQAQKTLNISVGQYTNDGWDSTGEPASTRTNFTQTNHFNQKLNKCFVLTKYDFTYAGTLNDHFITTGETLFDAFQNDELASCIHSHRLDYDKFPEEYRDTCFIGQGNGHASLENYNNFINGKMESGK